MSSLLRIGTCFLLSRAGGCSEGTGGQVLRCGTSGPFACRLSDLLLSKFQEMLSFSLKSSPE